MGPAGPQAAGVFFIPGIDLGLAYSTGMTELMHFGRDDWEGRCPGPHIFAISIRSGLLVA